MKFYHLLFVLLFLSINFNIMGQNHKETLVQQIEEESNWLDAQVIETLATLNFSESIWEKVLSNQMYPKGLSTFGRMGGAFDDLSDKFGDTYLNKKCGFGEAVDVDNRQYCTNTIEDLSGKYSITVNAQNVQGSKDAFKMVLSYAQALRIAKEQLIQQLNAMPKTWASFMLVSG